MFSIGFRIFYWYGGFCQRTESNLLFSLCTEVKQRLVHKAFRWETDQHCTLLCQAGGKRTINTKYVLKIYNQTNICFKKVYCTRSFSNLLRLKTQDHKRDRTEIKQDQPLEKRIITTKRKHSNSSKTC